MIVDMNEATTKLEPKLEELGCYSVAIKQNARYEGAGVLLAFRQETGDFITWEWTLHEGGTSGLHSGHYDMEYDEAMMDFEARGR